MKDTNVAMLATAITRIVGCIILGWAGMTLLLYTHHTKTGFLCLFGAFICGGFTFKITKKGASAD